MNKNILKKAQFLDQKDYYILCSNIFDKNMILTITEVYEFNFFIPNCPNRATIYKKYEMINQEMTGIITNRRQLAAYINSLYKKEKK
jgi:hypothetical protein